MQIALLLDNGALVRRVHRRAAHGLVEDAGILHRLVYCEQVEDGGAAVRVCFEVELSEGLS